MNWYWIVLMCVAVAVVFFILGVITAFHVIAQWDKDKDAFDERWKLGHD